MRKTFKLGELFSGPGGIAFGAKRAMVVTPSGEWTVEHAWATDYDRDTCHTYERNICPSSKHSVLCQDIRKLDFAKLKGISDIDALAFGFPCNDFSVVGKQRGIDGVYGPLYSFGVKILQLFKPKFFIAENVGGLRNANDGNTFRQILRDLTAAGYLVTPHLYKFEQYGVPQARHRIIIVGMRNDIQRVFRVPAPTHSVPITCRQALECPPIPVDAFNHEYTQQSPQVAERLSHIKSGENAFTANLPMHLQLKVMGAKISQIYKRLDADKPAYTITGSGGGGTHVYHWSENRALTNRERARLQTFPDDFEFMGGKESVRKQIGMAVPPDVAKLIFESVLKNLAGMDYPSISHNIGIAHDVDHNNNEHIPIKTGSPERPCYVSGQAI
ncbi:MAG: DNA cytosine methyltransferase [Methylophilaceae bacterium]|nr:DNA cytosine methyltransferase [Methylophilaceae bacterium]